MTRNKSSRAPVSRANGSAKRSASTDDAETSGGMSIRGKPRIGDFAGLVEVVFMVLSSGERQVGTFALVCRGGAGCRLPRHFSTPRSREQ